MGLSLTPKRTSRRQVARIAEDLEHREAAAALAALAASAALAALAAASVDQEAADGPADLEVQEELADQEEDLADSAGRAAQAGRMAAVRGTWRSRTTKLAKWCWRIWWRTAAPSPAVWRGPRSSG